MKICLVSKEVAGLRGGGIGTYVAEAGKALRAHGHQAWLLTSIDGDDERRRAERLPFHRVVAAGEGVPASSRAHLFHGQPHYGYSHLVHQTLQALGERFDYIEFADYEGEGLVPLQEQRLFATYGATVMAVTMHSPTWECFAYDGQAHRADLRLRETCNIEEEAIRIAPFLNSPSAGLRDEVLGRLGIRRDVAIIRYPMALSASPVQPTRPRARLGDLEFLYFGRIEPRKGVQELVEAFRELPDCRLTLIGGDVDYSPYGRSFRDHCRKRASANVQFLPPISRDELLGRLAATDVCIFPSRFENWPNTCIEAMAAGRVVLGSRHGGMSEMIEHGVSGFLVDGRSSRDIVRVIREELGANLGRLDEIGDAAARRIRTLSDQRVYCEAVASRIARAREAFVPAATTDGASHRVSVIVPFYSDRGTVDEAVDSVIAQTHPDLEILIVNDGSPLPDAEQILARQTSKDPRVRVLTKPNGGLGSARNHGVRHCSGEFVLFCDADNVLRPEYASTAVQVLLRCPDAWFVTPHARFFEDGTRRTIGTYNPLPFDRASCLTVNRFGDAGAFFRKSVFTERGLQYDEILISYEDWALWMDLAAKGMKGERVPRELYDYRVRSDSMMQVDGLPNHPALMGLLVQRHLPNATQAERDCLTTLFQVAGQTIGRIALGRQSDAPVAVSPPSPPPAPPPSAPSAVSSNWTPQPAEPLATSSPSTAAIAGALQANQPLRYKLIDELSRLSRKVPGANRVLRGLLGASFRLARAVRRR